MIIIQIYNSRYTSGITGDKIKLNMGERVKYQLKDGTIIDLIIDSERMKHKDCDVLGYEAIFTDDDKRYFAAGDQIIWWEGKIN